ncbi:hypothetical protein KQX54_009633 [Cotesia glomerata]|uniref:Uncharacterized protein n=1 Tax=Cotesia glomerata TaxID=32391 RepID=A0AAV7J096_COTGL|nr:hypothetical protein KQX54_009633 [Cotesia glomerata]
MAASSFNPSTLPSCRNQIETGRTGLMSVRIGNVHFWRHLSKLVLETLDFVAQQLCESLVAGCSLLRVLTNQ